MPDHRSSPVVTIALRDARELGPDRFLLRATLAPSVAALVPLTAGAVALHGDAATYAAARAKLLSPGKAASAIAAPALWPLRLLRGTVEQVEIMGAVIALLAGCRAAVAERGRQSPPSILTRPVAGRQFLAARLPGGAGLLATALAIAFSLTAVF